MGKLFEIIPRAVNASRLKNSLSESFVTKVICRVAKASPDFDLPERRRIVAPRMLMPLLFAAYIRMVTGMRSFSRKPRCCMIFKLAKQLWHPVSAMAGMSTALQRVVGSASPKVL